jgi:hypothetical protein
MIMLKAAKTTREDATGLVMARGRVYRFMDEFKEEDHGPRQWNEYYDDRTVIHIVSYIDAFLVPISSNYYSTSSREVKAKKSQHVNTGRSARRPRNDLIYNWVKFVVTPRRPRRAFYVPR